MSTQSLLLHHLRSHLRLVVCLSLAVALVAIASGYLLTHVRAAGGTTYYVAINGNDTYDGKAPSFTSGTTGPFHTVQHCATVAVAGDTCLIEGGTYHETVTPANSGTTTAPITFAPYQNAAVTIDGADPITNWVLASGSFYTANVTLPVALPQDTGFYANQLLVDGVMAPEARWPNTGQDLLYPTLATAGAGTTQGHIVDPHLPNVNWVGATLHLWEVGDPYTSGTATVTASSSGQISFTDFCYPVNCAQPGAQYYLSGVPGALDAPGEWSYDGSAHQLSFWSVDGYNPIIHTIEAKQRLFAFDLSGRSFITILNLAVFAATVKTDDASSYDTLNGLNVRYPTHYVTLGPSAISAHTQESGVYLWGSHNTLENSTIAYSAGSGVSLQGSYHTVTNNLIHDVDYMANYAAGIGIDTSDHLTITHNTIYNSGRASITNYNGSYSGTTLPDDTIAYNDLSRADALSTDGGEIYLCCVLDGTGTSIDHNWTHTPLSGRTVSDPLPGIGIYLDNGANHFLIHHNVSWGNKTGIFLHEGSAGTSLSNLVYNNTFASGQAQSLLVSAHDCTGSRYINNIYRSTASTCANATIANNLPPTTDPLFVDPSLNDYHLKTGSPAIDAGQVIPGITDGYVGAAPDEGAYEANGTDWTPGCSFVGCRFAGTQQASRYTQLSSGVTNHYNYLGNLDAGAWTRYAAVDFGSGISYFTASVAVDSAHAGQFLDLHLDSVSGPLIGSLQVQNTGGYITFVSQSTGVSGASGIHDFYVVARGGAGVANLAAFKFSSAPPDLALTATASASSSYEGSGWSLSYVNDGQYTSTGSSLGWSSGNTNATMNHTEWLQFDFGAIQSFGLVTLYPRTDVANTGYGFPIDFIIAVSNDGSTWTTVVSKTGVPLPSTAQTYNFAVQDARYIRVTGTSLRPNPYDSNQYRMQFAEIGVQP